ncbi:hypothetical protein HYW18_01995 [Candidatus Uhrbacteria bacterium]|nr:hypothetical protein [Candidatus Uhrbacteria bacterium]
MKILLIQSRVEPEMRAHERACITECLGLPPSDIHGIDSHKTTLEDIRLSGVDAIILGATGKTCILRESRERVESFSCFAHEARRRRIPMLGINFGAHILTIAFGGSVSHDEEHREVGSYTVRKCVAAAQDPIFRHLPDTFVVQLAHVDRMERPPEEAAVLLSSDGCSTMAWSFPGEGIYALEFQAESDKDDLAARLIGYHETYAGAPGELEYVMLRLRPSPEASRVLPLFLSEVVKKQQPMNV